MDKFELRKQKAAYIGKNVLIAAVLPVAFLTGAHAEGPVVTDAVSDINALQTPIALIGGAYIGLKVVQRGWRIVKGFI